MVHVENIKSSNSADLARWEELIGSLSYWAGGPRSTVTWCSARHLFGPTFYLKIDFSIEAYKLFKCNLNLKKNTFKNKSTKLLSFFTQPIK